MLNEVTRPAAQQILQLRAEGKVHSVEQALGLMGHFQPADGFDFDDFIALSDFIGQLEPCNSVPQAQKLATKYGLTLAS